jgi:hypothetical protein
MSRTDVLVAYGALGDRRVDERWMRSLFTGNGGGGNDGHSDNEHDAPEAMKTMFDHFHEV